MKTIPQPHTLDRRHQITTLSLRIGLIAAISTLPLHAQDDEWYNPGNWSVGNNSERPGTDWRDNDGWSNSNDYDTSSGHGAYEGNRTTSTDNETGRNQQQNRSDQQAGRNQQQNRSDQQAGRNQQQNRSDRYQQADSDQRESMRTVSFNGEVDGFKKINIKDSSGKVDEQTFVKISLDNDEERVVSLGSRLIVTDFDVDQGDQIRVTGRNVRIDNHDVLVASRIEVGDKVFIVRKHNRPNANQQFSFSGTVKDVSTTSLSEDSREDNLLVRLELENGKSRVVDLGPEKSLSDLNIEEGSEIRIQGEETKVSGKKLIVAHMISVDGDSTRLRDRSERNESSRRDNMKTSEYSQRDSR